MADSSIPQSWNLYAYAVNNPFKYVDPTGTDWCAWDDGTHDDAPENGGANYQDCVKQGGTWEPDLQESVTVFANAGLTQPPFISYVWNAPHAQSPFQIPTNAPNKSSYWSCVRSGLDGFSLQNGLQKISGGRLGTSWLAGAFLGNSVQSVGDTIAALAQGNVGGAANAAGSEAFGDTAGSIATKTASYVPNVAITVGVQAASSSGRLSMTAGASLPFGSLANAGAGFVSGALEALGTFKLPYDLSVASFSAVVCGIGR